MGCAPRCAWAASSACGLARGVTARPSPGAGRARGRARRRVLLDCEFICLNTEGKPDFAPLRARIRRQGGRPAAATLVIFDVLHLHGYAVRDLPYKRRRELLRELGLDGGSAWIVPRCFTEGLDAVLGATADQGLEGIVAKRLDSPWVEGRRFNAWVKQKHRRRERYVVSGWVPGDGRPDEFLIARLDGEPAGRVSFGLSGGGRSKLRAALAGAEARRGRGRIR